MNRLKIRRGPLYTVASPASKCFKFRSVTNYYVITEKQNKTLWYHFSFDRLGYILPRTINHFSLCTCLYCIKMEEGVGEGETNVCEIW